MSKALRYLASAMLVVVGLIHVLPLSGVLGAEQLTSLYGQSFSGTNLQILMRHRAVLFGLLGVFMIFAAFRPSFRTVAFIGGSVSVVSFLWLALSGGSYNNHIARVVTIDFVALVCLVVGFVAHLHVKEHTAT